MDMVLTSKELFLKLALPKKQAKILKTTLFEIVNKKYNPMHHLFHLLFLT